MKKLFAVFALAFLPIFSFAQERILNFSVKAEVQTDASAIITEEITINAEHNKINRGIFRDIPQSNLKIKSLSMDGAPHPYREEGTDNGLRVYFGGDDYLSRGVHTYKLVYIFPNAVINEREFDELYWNVTGNDSQFPIDKAEFEVVLPQGAQVGKDFTSVYTGYYGETGQDATISADNLHFETTRPLQAGEGFRVSVSWEKGLIKFPPFFERVKSLFAFFAKDIRKSFTNSFAIAGFIAAFFYCLYCFIIWKKYGQDPKIPSVVTEFTPPKENGTQDYISPAFMRYMLKRISNGKLLSIVLVSLCMKGKLEIIKEKKTLFGYTYALKKISDDAQGLSTEEAYALKKIAGGVGSKMSVERETNRLKLYYIMMDIGVDFLHPQFKKYIIENRRPLMPASIIFALIVLPTFCLSGCVFFFLFFYLMFQDSQFFCMLIYVFPFWILLAVSCFAYLLTSAYIDKVNEDGRSLLYKIACFKKYMHTAEKYRAELSDPTNAEKIFADYLPYAFALDMQNEWMKKFAGVISTAAIERIERISNIPSHIRPISRSRQISSSPSSSPRSSSGSGGGGFSGGGSGGGGGGGW